MSFDALLADLQALQTASEDLVKSMPQQDEEDKKVQSAVKHREPDEDDENPEENDDDEDDEYPDEKMGKSFLTDADGNSVEVVDATDLIKSLETRIDTNESNSSAALGSLVGLIKAQNEMLKSLGEAHKSQGEMMKSLQSQVARLGAKGTGRASLVANQRQMSKSQQPSGLAPEEFMMKALNAQAAGRLTSIDIAVAEGYLQRGLPVPVEITNRVFEG